jgi:hypothetical protein
MNKITIAIVTITAILIAVGTIISLTEDGGTAQQQSIAQTQELTESSVSDFLITMGIPCVCMNSDRTMET